MLHLLLMKLLMQFTAAVVGCGNDRADARGALSSGTLLLACACPRLVACAHLLFQIVRISTCGGPPCARARFAH